MQGGVTPIHSIVMAATAHLDPYTKEGVELLCSLPYNIFINVLVVNGQRLKFNAVKAQKIRVVNSQTPKRAGQSFDLWLQL